MMTPTKTLLFADQFFVGGLQVRILDRQRRWPERGQEVTTKIKLYREMLEDWIRSYRPGGLSDATRRQVPHLQALAANLRAMPVGFTARSCRTSMT